MSKTILLLFVLSTTLLCNAFLFGGGAGNGCQTCCPAPVPCNCAPQNPCQGYAVARARDDKTVTAQPFDELELRAQAVGVQLDRQPTFDTQITIPRQLELLERLGEDSSHSGPPFAQSYFESSNVRFSPQHSVESDSSAISIDDETSTTDKMVELLEQTTTTTSDPMLESDHISEDDEDIKCNSQVLKKLMLDKMTENSAVSKRQINLEAERIFGGNIDVVCSRGHFSYIYSSALYCEASKGPTTCIAFRQTK